MKVLIQIAFLFISCLLAASCQEAVEHTAGAIRDRDSVAVMTSLGVNTLISDSGIIKYRIVTERWEVNQNKKPSRWTFDKGLFLEQLVTPERTLQGSYFRSDEHMTHYLVTNSRGSFESTDFGGGSNAGSTPGEMPDSMQMQQRSRALPSRNQ